MCQSSWGLKWILGLSFRRRGWSNKGSLRRGPPKGSFFEYGIPRQSRVSAEAKKRSVGKGKRDKDVSLTLVRRGVMKSFRFKGLTGSWVIHFFLPLPVFLAADFLAPLAFLETFLRAFLETFLLFLGAGAAALMVSAMVLVLVAFFLVLNPSEAVARVAAMVEVLLVPMIFFAALRVAAIVLVLLAIFLLSIISIIPISLDLYLKQSSYHLIIISIYSSPILLDYSSEMYYDNYGNNLFGQPQGMVNPQPMSNPSNLFANNAQGQRQGSHSVLAGGRPLDLTCLTCNTVSNASNSYECSNCRQAKKRQITQNRDELLEKYKKEMQNKKTLTEEIKSKEKEVEAATAELTATREKHQLELQQKDAIIETFKGKIKGRDSQIAMLQKQMKEREEEFALKIQRQHRFLNGENQKEWGVLHDQAEKLTSFATQISEKIPSKGKQSSEMIRKLEKQLIVTVREQLNLLPRNMDKLIEQFEGQKKKELEYLKKTKIEFGVWLEQRKKSFAEAHLVLEEGTAKSMLQPMGENIDKIELFLKEIDKMREKVNHLQHRQKEERGEKETERINEKEEEKEEKVGVEQEKADMRQMDFTEMIQLKESESDLI